MKILIVFLISMISISAFSNTLPLYPSCFKGTLKMSTGETKDVLLSFNRVEKFSWNTHETAILNSFQIGNENFENSGDLISANEVQFNSNDDYIPGGNASYNEDIYLKFDGKSATGFYKLYQFDEGVGGFEKSNANELKIEGTFNLRKCKIKVIED